jgi:hypothetical protein
MKEIDQSEDLVETLDGLKRNEQRMDRPHACNHVI